MKEIFIGIVESEICLTIKPDTLPLHTQSKAMLNENFLEKDKSHTFLSKTLSTRGSMQITSLTTD